MRASHRFVVAAVACTVGLTLACSGKTVGGDGGSSGGGSSACDDYFNAAFSGSCPGILNTPPGQVAHIQSRFDTLCAAALALPGVSITPDGLETCVAAIKSTSCAVLSEQYGVCSFSTGSLSAGGSCVTSAQCQSGDCSSGTQAPDGGTLVCGSCATALPVGASCVSGQSCGPSATCVPGANGAGTCVTIANVGAGGACSSQYQRCNPGLVCDTGGHCAAPAGAGTACQLDEECTAPLVCPAVNGPATCQPPGGAGAPCNSAVECTTGLGCDFPTHQCTTVTWVAAGQPCNSGSIECLVGSCHTGTTGSTGTCPTVIPDGQPCNTTDGTATCDSFAQCTGGVCVLGYPSCP